MGCQVSRFEQNEDGQPARLGLFRRFEYVGRLRRSETLSEKQLNEEEEDGQDEKGCTTKHNDKDVSHIPVVSIGHKKAHSLDGVSLQMIDSDEEKEERDNDREDHLFVPRSPSFREYCVNYYSMELDMDDGHIEGEKRKKKSPRKEGNAPPNPNEGTRTKEPKKGLKRRSFRKVLRNDGSLKNLWNSTCYNPSFSSSDHDKPQKQRGGKLTHDRRHSFHH